MREKPALIVLYIEKSAGLLAPPHGATETGRIQGRVSACTIDAETSVIARATIATMPTTFVLVVVIPGEYNVPLRQAACRLGAALLINALLQ